LKREARGSKEETAEGREGGEKCAGKDGPEMVEYPAGILKIAKGMVAPLPVERGTTISKRLISFSASSVKLRALSDPPCSLES
jgi:hypothetical protein